MLEVVGLYPILTFAIALILGTIVTCALASLWSKRTCDRINRDWDKILADNGGLSNLEERN